MQDKTITITIDEQGHSTLDLEGFTGRSCEKVFEEFRNRDRVEVERKKPAYYANPYIDQKQTERLSVHGALQGSCRRALR